MDLLALLTFVFCCERKLAHNGVAHAVCFSRLGIELMYLFLCNTSQKGCLQVHYASGFAKSDDAHCINMGPAITPH